MERVEELIKSLNEFKDWEILEELTSTQKRGAFIEKFVEDCFSEAYGSFVFIHKMGSQEHPDFMIVPTKYVKSIERFRHKELHQKSITGKVLKAWEQSEYNEDKIQILRIEVKTKSKQSYALNDTFPTPLDYEDTIYFLASVPEEKIYVTTSYTMARNSKTKPTVESRYIKSKDFMKSFRSRFKSQWADVPGITTYSRPNYSMNSEYAHIQAPVSRIKELVSRAGF